MIATVAVGGALALICLGLLASPWPFLSPVVIVGLAGLAGLYRRPAWGLLGIAALVPFEGLFKGSDFTGAKLLGASMIVILALQLLLRQLPDERLRNNLWRPLALFLLAYLISLMFSERYDLSLGHLRELAVGLALFVITVLVAAELNIKMLFRLVSLSVAATCALALISAKHQIGGRAIGLLEDANYFALLIAFAAPMSAWLALRAPHLLARVAWLGVTLLLLAGMTKTDSRSGLVVLVGCLLIGLWHHRAELRQIRSRHLGFVLLGAAIVIPLGLMSLPADYVARIKSLVELKSGINAHQDASLGRRASYLVVGSQMIRDNPLAGSGPGTFPVHYAATGFAKAFSEEAGTADLYRRAHNTYLEIFSEVGIPGGLLFAALILFGLRNFERARQASQACGDAERADLATHLALSFLAMALFLMFLSAPNHKYLWIMLGLSGYLRLEAEARLARMRQLV